MWASTADGVLVRTDGTFCSDWPDAGRSCSFLRAACIPLPPAEVGGKIKTSDQLTVALSSCSDHQLDLRSACSSTASPLAVNGCILNRKHAEMYLMPGWSYICTLNVRSLLAVSYLQHKHWKHARPSVTMRRAVVPDYFTGPWNQLETACRLVRISILADMIRPVSSFCVKWSFKQQDKKKIQKKSC